jgi:UDP-N-acetylglucosamine--N-acetylmuramyl-(pentapeptide) pyrophosphoryl-undecaprenol N-acetylglucosamine transferase
MATKTLTGFPDTLPKGEWVGNPIRSEFESIAPPSERYAGRTGPLTLLVVGGSLGAAALNETIPAALALIPAEERPHVLHQAGEKHVAELKQRYADCGVAANVHAFISDMAGAYAAADLVVCRSGAMTVSEIAACGVAACFVPFPFAIDDHQTANAEFLSRAGAATLWPQNDLNPSALAAWLQSVSRPDLMAKSSVLGGLLRLRVVTLKVSPAPSASDAVMIGVWM